MKVYVIAKAFNESEMIGFLKSGGRWTTELDQALQFGDEGHAQEMQKINGRPGSKVISITVPQVHSRELTEEEKQRVWRLLGEPVETTKPKPIKKKTMRVPIPVIITLVDTLNNCCQQCDEGQCMTFRPFVYEDDGEDQSIKFFFIPIWNSEDDLRDENLSNYDSREHLNIFVIKEANKILSAIKAIKLE